jgi:chromosome partitioning protein
MAFVIAVASRKGGAGKSTVAANVATALAARGLRVGLLDTDPQKTLARWQAERAKHGERAAALAFDDPSGWRVPNAVERLAGMDALVMDTAPHAETEARIAIRAADLVLIPLQPSAADVWAMQATLELAAAERREAALLLNRVPAQGRAPEQVAAELAARKLPLLAARLGNRTGFAAAFAEGLGAVEGVRGLAAEEAAALAELLAARIGTKSRKR